MTSNLLLYGATGYTGRLIAAEAKALGMSQQQPVGEFRMILAGRHGGRLKEVAEKYDMPFRVFGLDDPAQLRKGLDNIQLVINAAGPFVCTAEPLANAALETGVHYVDINNEADVYMRLDQSLRDKAAEKGLAIVSGSGCCAAASDVLLDTALQQLLAAKTVAMGTILETVRIAMPLLPDFSRGIAKAIARSLRDRAIVVLKMGQAARPIDRLVFRSEPVGKTTRQFNFGSLPRDGTEECDTTIASLVSLIDTPTARLSIDRNNLSVRCIESYVRLGAAGRLAYQTGGMLALVSALPGVRALTNAQLSLLPDGPTPQERQAQRHVVVLEIEDHFRTTLIDWRWETPNVFQFTAQLVLAVARSVIASGKTGWMTPAEALGPQDLDHPSGTLRCCTLQRRTG